MFKNEEQFPLSHVSTVPGGTAASVGGRKLDSDYRTDEARATLGKVKDENVAWNNEANRSKGQTPLVKIDDTK
jgi:hypothetical protein